MIIPLSKLSMISNPAELCSTPYPGHRRGCPNLGEKYGCPPSAKRFDVWADAPYFAIVNEFSLQDHVNRMADLHPTWSNRQLECCLYWQQTARKELEVLIAHFRCRHPDLIICRCPEAAGVNVTQTLKDHGLLLEWPPKKIVRQVAIAAALRSASCPTS